MAFKQELIATLEQIASTLPNKKITLILCCEGDAELASLYGTKTERGMCTVLTVVASAETILNIMDYAYRKSNSDYETQETLHRP